MELRRRPGYWIWVGGPVPPGAAAMTLGRLVLVRRRAADDGVLLRHEEEHVGQWRRLGVPGFLALTIEVVCRIDVGASIRQTTSRLGCAPPGVRFRVRFRPSSGAATISS
jgi:hypothetical protein